MRAGGICGETLLCHSLAISAWLNFRRDERGRTSTAHRAESDLQTVSPLAHDARDRGYSEVAVCVSWALPVASGAWRGPVSEKVWVHLLALRGPGRADARVGRKSSPD
jgi:hypothetical protein